MSAENESPFARDATDQDLFGTPGEYQTPQVLRGTVGWDGEPSWADLGDDTNGGITLVRVTLFRGKQVGRVIKPGAAQGHQILVAIPDGIMRIPPLGAECIVVFPDGDTQTPGAGVLLCTIPRPKKNSGLYKNLKPGEVCIYGGAPDDTTNPACIVIKNTGSIALKTEDPSGNAIFMTLTPTKWSFAGPWGTWLFDYSGVHARAGGAKFDMGGASGAVFDAIGGAATGMGTYVTLTAANITASGYCLLGLPSVPGTYFQAGMYPLPTPPATGLIPVPLVPPMAPVMFFSPSVRVAT